MELLPAWMFLALTILLMAGFPVTFTLLGTALVFGMIDLDGLFLTSFLSGSGEE
jgi:TRAP-type mannitol/chloroaromatic compound transport system permease large subunit